MVKEYSSSKITTRGSPSVNKTLCIKKIGVNTQDQSFVYIWCVETVTIDISFNHRWLGVAIEETQTYTYIWGRFHKGSQT